MDRRIVEYSEMESVLFRLRCVYETLILLHSHSASKPLYCAADELMHITDEFGDFLSEAAPAPEEP
ncbi:MAG: hypothetical protein IJR48_04030 [Oscillibacter sp.]|nr:hypothetical protein [Oscillibacter sp.]MBQ7681134.1 hypothetical protein [Oscillibacter sp.]MBQ9617513.1 hypothetical protein [Oscillibacter sp.]